MIDYLGIIGETSGSLVWTTTMGSSPSCFTGMKTSFRRLCLEDLMPVSGECLGCDYSHPKSEQECFKDSVAALEDACGF
jgi:hypothetical protein